jgi:hypothetical protein
VLIWPWGPGRVVRGKGRLREAMQPSQGAEGLIDIDIAARAAALLDQPLSGEQTEPGTGGGDHRRAGIARRSHELIEPELG